MKTIEELKTFYNETLSADLQALEQQRKAILQKISIVGIVMAVVLLGVLSVAAQSGAFPVIIFIFVAAIIIFGIIARVISGDYVAKFKSNIIGRIVKFIDPSLDYIPKGRIEKDIFMDSDIFKTKPNRYKGDDYVRGTIGKTPIEFSEIDAEYESGSGKDKHTVTVFKGIFFVGDFNKHFTCKTVVLPDTTESLFGSFGKIFQAWNLSRDQLIKLEDPEFEKLFVVYGTDQIQARYILSTSLMARITDFKKKTGQKIFLSFIDSKVYVAISYTKKLFEPKVFSTLMNFELIREYFEDLQLATGIVDDLNLNTRIWSKQ
jgi:hypothetical protein